MYFNLLSHCVLTTLMISSSRSLTGIDRDMSWRLSHSFIICTISQLLKLKWNTLLELQSAKSLLCLYRIVRKMGPLKVGQVRKTLEHVTLYHYGKKTNLLLLKSFKINNNYLLKISSPFFSWIKLCMHN